MNEKLTRRAVLLAGISLPLMEAGCGGGSSATGNSSGQRGTLTLVVNWPVQSRGLGKVLSPSAKAGPVGAVPNGSAQAGSTGGLTASRATGGTIPVGAHSILVSLVDPASGSQLAPSQLVTPPPTDSTTNQTIVHFTDVRVGAVRMNANALPDTAGKQSPIATGTATGTVVANTTLTLNVAFTLSLSSFAVSPTAVTVSPAITAANHTAKVTAAALDSSSHTLLYPLTWVSADPTIATVTYDPANSQTATITGAGAGSTTVTATEPNSGMTAAVQVTVSTSRTSTFNVFIVDSGNTRLVGLDKVPATVFDTYGGPNLTELYNPNSVALDSQGRIYIADYQPGQSKIIRLNDLTGAGRVMYAPQGSTASVVAVDQAGRIYFRDDNASLNRIDDISGANPVKFGGFNSIPNQPNPLGNLFSIAFDSKNRIYMSTGSSIVRIDDMSGTNLVSFGATGTGINQFRFPYDVAIDGRDRIYVADSGNGRIARFDDMTGTNWTTFSPPAGAQAAAPHGLFVDRLPNPKIYFTDTQNNRVSRMDDMNGTNLVMYGTAGSGNGQFSFPISIAVVQPG